jgi:hypothetical protein
MRSSHVGVIGDGGHRVRAWRAIETAVVPPQHGQAGTAGVAVTIPGQCHLT